MNAEATNRMRCKKTIFKERLHSLLHGRLVVGWTAHTRETNDSSVYSRTWLRPSNEIYEPTKRKYAEMFVVMERYQRSLKKIGAGLGSGTC